MFHVSFPTLIYKHWLSGVLNFLYDNFNNINEINYLDFLEKFNDRLFYGRFSEDGPLEYFKIIFSNEGIKPIFKEAYLNESTNIQNFIFNRLDYLIWKECIEKRESLNCPSCNQIGNIDNFIFSFRSSVEHYYPQHPIKQDELNKSDKLPHGVDDFGNLCLISRSVNSKLSNHSPVAKKDYYRESPIIESLKQQLMMSYVKWGNDSLENIVEHGSEMKKLLCSVYNKGS